MEQLKLRLLCNYYKYECSNFRDHSYQMIFNEDMTFTLQDLDQDDMFAKGKWSI